MTTSDNQSPLDLGETLCNQKVSWLGDAGRRKLLFWQICILTSQIIVGYDEAIVGSFQSMKPWLMDMGNPSSELLGLIVAVVFIGGIIGAFLASWPADRFGRRPAIFVGSLICVVGSITQSSARGVRAFIAGRLILGIGISFTTSAGPSLLNELAHPQLRGKIASMFNVLWYVGSIIASWLAFGTGHIDNSWSWRIPSIVQAAAPLFVMVSAVFMPESPRWLYSKGRIEEAKKVLVTYHANGDENDILVAYEMQEIAHALALEAERKLASWSLLLKTKANRKRFTICVSVAVLTLWNGQGVISYYLSPILNSVGIIETNQQTGINGGMAIWNLICSVVGALLADRVGRRTLWLASFVGMMLANVPLTISSAMYAKHGSQPAAYVTILFLFLYNAAFNIACNPLLYCYTTEILPYTIRTRGLALQIIIGQLALTVNQFVNPIALDRIGFYYFVFYLGMLILGTLIIYFTFPETKGYSLEELGTLFDSEFVVIAPKAIEGQAVQVQDWEEEEKKV